MSSKSNSSNSTENNVTNYSLQGVNAQSVVAGNNNTVTDFGAVNGALSLSSKAIDSNHLISLSSMDGVKEMAQLAANQTAEAWKTSTAETKGAYSDVSNLLRNASAENADRVQQMANAVASKGQSIIDQSTKVNMYVIAGVAAVSLIAVAIIAVSIKGKK